jgi:preprotein translocase subunit SecY
MLNNLKHIFTSKTIRDKILFTLAILLVYRFFVYIPVPFVNIDVLLNAFQSNANNME